MMVILRSLKFSLFLTILKIFSSFRLLSRSAVTLKLIITFTDFSIIIDRDTFLISPLSMILTNGNGVLTISELLHSLDVV